MGVSGTIGFEAQNWTTRLTIDIPFLQNSPSFETMYVLDMNYGEFPLTKRCMSVIFGHFPEVKQSIAG